jgi:hypothetical protein
MIRWLTHFFIYAGCGCLTEFVSISPMQAFGRNQISVQVTGFGFQDLGFADTWHLKPITPFPMNQVVSL